MQFTHDPVHSEYPEQLGCTEITPQEGHGTRQTTLDYRHHGLHNTHAVYVATHDTLPCQVQEICDIASA